MVSPQYLKTQTRSKLVSSIKKGKNVVIGEGHPQAVIIGIEEYNRYRLNAKMEVWEKEVKDVKEYGPTFSSAEEAMDYLVAEISK